MKWAADHEWYEGKYLKMALDYFKVLTRHLTGQTEEYHKKPVRITGNQAETWTR
jgi:phosphate-selective porin